MALGQGFQCHDNWHLSQMTLRCGVCSVHCMMFSSILGLYPRDARSCHPTVTTKSVLTHSQGSWSHPGWGPPMQGSALNDCLHMRSRITAGSKAAPWGFLRKVWYPPPSSLSISPGPSLPSKTETWGESCSNIPAPIFSNQVEIMNSPWGPSLCFPGGYALSQVFAHATSST